MLHEAESKQRLNQLFKDDSEKVNELVEEYSGIFLNLLLSDLEYAKIVNSEFWNKSEDDIKAYFADKEQVDRDFADVEYDKFIYKSKEDFIESYEDWALEHCYEVVLDRFKNEF